MFLPWKFNYADIYLASLKVSSLCSWKRIQTQKEMLKNNQCIHSTHDNQIEAI